MSRRNKMQKDQMKYSIGLDIGVGSVGWACITPDFQVLQHQGRYAIGTREFSSANTAEERRIQRGTRRRYNRRIKRIQLLQQTLEPLFNHDPTFFMKHDEDEKHFWRNSNRFRSNTLSETLSLLGKNSRKYPTIYHLRHALIKENTKFNPRLIYLALHNLTKFRGHFLNENMQWNDSSQNESFQEQLKRYFTLLNEYQYNIEVSDEELNDIENILKNKTLNSSDKRTKINKLIGREQHHANTLIIGLKANIARLFSESENQEVYQLEKLSIHFDKVDMTEVYEKLTDEEQEIVNQANIIYQSINLHELIGDARYVSEAKVQDYEQFGKDLAFIKRVYNAYYNETEYREMFITPRKNWTKYHRTRDEKLLSKFDQFLKIKQDYEDEFYAHIKRVFTELLKNKSLINKDKKLLTDAVDRIDKGQFLMKQKTYLNAAIPHQNNVYEAERILKQQQQYHPEITEDMIEKVKQIIGFRIPYYMGPLVKQERPGDFGWLIRKKDDIPVLPWNIDEVVDRSASAEEFIDRMTSYCMYLTKEKVLPKNSLLYERFELLNELNGIQIRATSEERNRKYRLSADEKQWIIDHVFRKRKNVTIKHLQDALKKSELYKGLIIDSATDSLKQIHGTQQENGFSTNLSTYIDMTNIFGEVNSDNIEMIEEIIYWITVFEDKNIIEMKIKETYPQIKQSQINKLIHLNYAGWGRLSKRLLDGIPVNQASNKTMIEIMENEPNVFMEVLNIEKYNLSERIAKMNQDSEKEMTKIKYQDIANLQGSPALKKAIWQAVLIVEELVDLFGEPENIMIEFAREEGQKARVESRKQQINKIKKQISKEEKELKAFINEHSQYDEAKYRQQRLYLYITQEGKCLYSGERLNIGRLQDYEVDHIYPRSFVPDDSIDNLALVTHKMNAKKSGTKMPLEILSPSEQYKQKVFWKKLYDNNLISNRKYFRLLKDKFTDQDKETFFARQLVETRQITKHVKNLLEERFGSTDIHTVNAEVVTNLRKHSNITKVRSMNSKHHAVDAALSAIVIQFILNRYGHNFLDFNFKYQEAQKKWRKLMSDYGKNFFLFSEIDKYNKFGHYKTGEVLSGREYFSVLNDEMPWQTTKKIGTEESAFYKETLHSPKKKQNPSYKSSKIKHGVYDEMKTDCTYLISYAEENAKGKIVKKSDFVDLYVIEKYQKSDMSEEDLARFLAEKVARGRVINAVIHTKLEKYQRIKIDDAPFYYISSRELHNGKQLLLPKQTLKDFYSILNKRYSESVDPEFLQQTFRKIADTVNDEYSVYLPENNRERITNYVDEITDLATFNKGIEELFKTTSASAARSTKFGYRYTRKVYPESFKIIHESITGLRRRRPRSFRHELWSL